MMVFPKHRYLCVLILVSTVAQEAVASKPECACKAVWHGNHSNLPRFQATRCENQQGCPAVACDFGNEKSWCEVVDKDCEPPLGFHYCDEDKDCMFCNENSTIESASAPIATQQSADKESSIDPLLVTQIVCVVLLSCTACVCCGGFVASSRRDHGSLMESAQCSVAAVGAIGCCGIVGLILLGAWLSQTEYQLSWSRDCSDPDCVASPVALFTSIAALYFPAGVAVYFVVFTLATGPEDKSESQATGPKGFLPASGKHQKGYSKGEKQAACLWALKMFFIDTFDTLLSLLFCIWLHNNEVEVFIQVIAGISCALGFIQWMMNVGFVIGSAMDKYVEAWTIPGCLGLFADIFSLTALFVLETASDKGDLLPVIMKLLDFVLSALGLGGDFVQIIAPMVGKKSEDDNPKEKGVKQAETIAAISDAI